MHFDREWWWDELLHSLASYSLLSLHAYKIEDCRTLSPSCLVSQLTRTRCCLQDLDLFSFFFNFWKIILQMNIQAANYVEWSEIITSLFQDSLQIQLFSLIRRRKKKKLLCNKSDRNKEEKPQSILSCTLRFTHCGSSPKEIFLFLFFFKII